MLKKVPRVYKPKYISESVTGKKVSYYTFKICTVTAGKGLWNINGEEYRAEKYDSFLLCSNDLRFFSKIEDSLEMLVCEIMPGTFDNMFLSLFTLTGGKKIRYFKANDIDGFLDSLKCAHKLYERKDKYANNMVSCHIELALSILLDYFKDSLVKTKKINREVMSALEYIAKHLSDDFTLSDVAKTVNLSPSALSKKFTRCMGMGFNKYVMQQRIYMASDKLLNLDDNVLDIAFSCGFHNSAAFYDAFKKITGTTPSAMRKRPNLTV